MWSLTKIHQVGELCAALAVVLSLLFVGYEVRQNNLNQVRSATREVLRDYETIHRLLAEDIELTCVYIRGNQDFGALSRVESMRYSVYMNNSFRSIQAMYNLFQEGAIEDEVWENMHAILSDTTLRPGFREWIAARSGWFDENFRGYLMEMISRPVPDGVLDVDDPMCSTGA